MKNKQLILLTFFFLIGVQTYGNKPISNNEIKSFSTNGQTVYHLQTGSVAKGQRCLFTAAIDGVVKCQTPDGKLIWQATTNDGFPFDLCVADIDNDGLDEVLVASGNGSLYAFDNNGTLLWKFSKVPPIYQVTVAKQKNGNTTILAGGVEQILYALSPDGKLLNSLKTEYCIRHLRSGNFLNDGNEYVAMATTSSGLTGILSLFLINPTDLSVIWKKENLGQFANDNGKRFFSMLAMDINHDDFDEILLSGGWGENGIIYAFDHKGESIFTKSDKKIPNIQYRMNLLRKVKLPTDEFILGHFGNVLIVYELDGTLREVIKGPHSFADSYFDSKLNTLFMGSSVSGGDEIYKFRLDQPGWQKEFETLKAFGKLAIIENNIKTLNKQINEFVAPAYQPAPINVNVIIPIIKSEKFKHISFTKNIILTQKIDSREEIWCKQIDRRMPYEATADELVNLVSKYEADGQNIIIWAGHGDAVYFPTSTFEKMMKAAPKHLLGFVFAEMEGTNEKTQEVVENVLLPVAELCKEHGKIIVFRNKNVFWNGTCYMPFWKKILLNEKFSDVFIPGLEETNCRSQELSLAGRIGLWQSGIFNHWACRTVTDNANFDRMFEWAGQQTITHHFRNLVSTASMGADLFFSDIHAGENTPALFEQLNPFYNMIEKGIIQIPTKNQLLSLSGFALGMKSPPSKDFIKHGANGHKYSYPIDVKSEMVFDRLDAYWSGSTLESFDYSNYALNVKRRMCNFLPETPFGLTAIVPADTKTGNKFKKIIETDGQYFYDESGKKFTATEYKPTVEAALAQAAAELPIIVKGDVHWSAIQLDAKHIRITLIDPGYLDPAERQATIILQKMKGVSCTDILSRESIPIKDGKISLTVPAGIFRIIDINHN